MTERKANSRHEPQPFVIQDVWQKVTPELRQELLEFWKDNRAIRDTARASNRADQVICIGRDAQGQLVAVSTAEVRILPRLRQPMYYYRLFFAQRMRGQGHMPQFVNRGREVLQAYNATLERPEALGILVELESRFLAAFYKDAYVEEMDCTFIGYSPRGLPIFVSYFDGARLLPPAPLRMRGAVGAGA